MRAPVEIHIGRLILEGIEPGSERALAMALRRELGRQWASQGVPGAIARGGALRRVSAGEVVLPAGMNGAAAGAALGRAIYAGLKR
jgi:hypothetical protein